MQFICIYEIDESIWSDIKIHQFSLLISTLISPFY